MSSARALHDLQRLLAAGGLQHLVAALLERPRREAAHGVLVFHQQDGSFAGDIARRRGFGARLHFAMMRGRKMLNVVPRPTSLSTR